MSRPADMLSMSQRMDFCRSVRITTFIVLLLTSYAAMAQIIAIPGTTAAGTQGPVTTVSMTVSQSATLDRVKVLTGGAYGLDFTDLGTGSCHAGLALLAGQACTVQVGLVPTAPGERRGAVLLLDAAGHTLAMSRLSAAATGPLATFVPGTMQTVAGDSAWIYAGDGNPATSSSIFLPFGFAVDSAGNLFIADSSNNRIRRVDGITQVISTVAGTGVIGSTGDGGPASTATLSGPTSVALDAAGNLFFSDAGNNVVRRIDAFTHTISTYAGTPGQHGYSGDLAAATQALLNSPSGISLDAAGNLYIADTANHAIRRVDAATGTISTVCGRGFAGFSGDGGPAVSAGLNSPWSVTPGGLTDQGALYIADQGNHRIRRVDANGIIETIMGNGQAGITGDNGPASQAQLNVPASVAVDIAGNIYVADSGNNRVRKILRSTGVVVTVAGNSSEAFSGDDGPADLAGLYGPYTLALDSSGNLFIADVFHNRIRKVSAAAATLQYPAIRVGRVSAALTQTLENDGNAPLTPSALRTTQESMVDAANTTCAVGTALKPLDQCVLSLQFAPKVTGERVRGLFDLDSDATNAPSEVSLIGKVLDVDPATIAVASSANPSATGATVIFTATVTSDGTTPTGQITLYDGTNAIATAQLGAGGIGTFSVANLTGGQHNITVQYAGDASNAAAVSTPLLQVVKDQQAATATGISSNSNPAVSGAPVTLTANVSVVTTGAGNGSIGGSVAFREGVNQLGSANVTNGIASFTAGSLTPGTHSIVAVYSGSSSYAGSTSTVLSQVITQAVTHTVLTAAINPSVAGAGLQLSAAVSGNGGIPGGPVSFMEGSLNLGMATLNAQGMAVLAVPGNHWVPGAHMLKAFYAGDAADAASVSDPLAQTVTQAQTKLQLSSSVNPAALGAAVTLTAQAGSNGGIPSGPVQFLDGTAVLGAATLDAGGTASLTTSSLPLGDHQVTAVYAGDTNDSSATSAVLVQQIQAATIGITMASSGNPTLFNAPLTLSAQVTGSGSNPVGTVTFLDGAAALGTAPLSASGAAQLAASSLSIGAHTLTALYSGDTNHGAATSAAYPQQILQATTTTVSSSANTVIAGLPVTLTASTTGASGKPFSGDIVLSDGATLLARQTPQNGSIMYTTAMLAVGHHTFTAAYAGDPDDQASSSTTASVDVNQADTRTTFTTAVNPAFAGDPLAFTVAVSGNGAVPSGQVTLLDGATPVASVTLLKGNAQGVLNGLAPGVHTLSAVYAGDSFDGTSQSAPVSQQIAQKTSVSLLSGVNPSLLTDAVTVTVNVSNGVPGAPPTGLATLTDGGTVVGSATLTAGTASFTMSAPPVGTHALVATYAGDSANTPATSAALLQVVTLRPSGTSFTASNTALSAGQPLVLVSVVQTAGPASAGQNRPTGTVTYQSGSTVVATVTLNAGGVATWSGTPVEAVYQMVAVYSGDNLYAPSTSPAITITVGPTVEFTMSLKPDNITMKSGDHGALSISVVTAKTFVDTLSFGCAGLPQYATCTFSEPQFTAGGGLPHNLTVTVDTGNPLGSGATAEVRSQTAATVYSCGLGAGALLTLLLGKKRRRLRGLLLALIALAALPAVNGCGTSFTQKATVAGAYSFQIVATGTTTHATNTAVVQMKVTQ